MFFYKKTYVQHTNIKNLIENIILSANHQK